MRLLFIIFISIVFSQSDHLLFKKIVTRPTDSEMVVIYNPTNNAVDLSNYYLSDAVRASNSSYYYNLPNGENYWSGLATDFIARFPENYSINAGDSLIVGLHTQSMFNSSYGYDADLNLFEDFRNAVEDSVTISYGEAFSSQNILGDSQEMLILFYWDGSSTTVKDVDYFLWGSNSNAIDKTGIEDYLNDTPIVEQNYINSATEGEIYIRIDFDEGSESSENGNGFTGNDETSENLSETWQLISAIGCTDVNAINFDSSATIDDGSCIISLAGVETGNYSGQSIKVQGLVVDYFDITVFNGPHAITIDDGSGGEAEIIIWPDEFIPDFEVLTNYPFGKYHVEFTGSVSEYCDDDDGESSGCESLPWECADSFNKENSNFENDEYLKDYPVQDNHCTWQIQVMDPSDVVFLDTLETNYPLITIQELNSGDYHHQNVELKGLVADYFDITSYCGPHAITLKDSTEYQVEIVIFDQDFSDNLSCIVQSPYSRYEVIIKGYVGEYNNEIQIGMPGEFFIDGTPAIEVLNVHGCMNPAADNFDSEATVDNGSCSGELFGCTDPMADNYNPLMVYDDGSCFGGNYGCTIETAPNFDENSINPCNLFGNANDCCLEPYENEVQISELLEDFANEFEFYNSYKTVRGRIVDYFDVTVYGGPHSITIEDDFGYRVEFSIWENQWNISTNSRAKNYLEKLISPPYNQYEIQAVAKVDQYDGELQLDVLNPSNFLIIQEYDFDGELVEGDGACFNNNAVFVENDKLACDEMNYNWYNSDKAKIIPVAYVIIPSIGEKLDFSYITPENSRVIVRLFDLSGRFITTLVDRYDKESGVIVHQVQSSSWNGRDNTGQIVAPGTYLMHIEAMNFQTGETTKDVAPVVVGVK